MNVWKIASRWSNTGTKKSSILDLFRKYGIVFAGKETEKIRKSVKPGDLIAISDGIKIVSVAKVISSPVSVTSFQIEESDKKRFDYNDWVIGFKVEIFNLNQNEIFTSKMGTFHGMGKYSKQVEELFNNKSLGNGSFEINTYTYSLFDSNPNNQSLLQQGIKYVIPVYQRPYSWNESQIENLLNDIFISFWGNDKSSLPESIFIGTMQLSDKKYYDDNSYYQEVIDGQQRITTLTLLLKFLSTKYPKNRILKTLNFDWLDTDVNRGQQSKDLKEVLQDNNCSDELNKYAQNYKLLSEYFEQNIQNDEEDIEFEEDDFINHLLTNLYFVIIETKAGLSKTLQIFNAINTTGLDLNATDVFKIRLYEYLSKDRDSKNIFESIDKLYEKLDVNNNRVGRKFTDMNGILNIYKLYLVGKYKLNMTLWKMGTGTFFERLFDTLLNIKQWDGFATFKNEIDILKVEDIDKIIDIRYKWEETHYGEQGDFDDFNTMLSLRLLWWSRYSAYWTIAFIYLLKDNPVDTKFNRLIQELSRLYIVYTLLYQKQINEIHRFTKNITEKLVNGNTSIDDITEEIKNKYISKENEIKKVINGNIFWNPKIKNILTRMSAAIDEDENGKSIKEIEKLIFVDHKIDIEHIQSRNHEDEKIRESVKKEWGEELNSIGNLMILEYSINRSISNSLYDKKIKKYENSKFLIVKSLSDNYPVWDLNRAKERKEKEIVKIIKFLKLKKANE